MPKNSFSTSLFAGLEIWSWLCLCSQSSAHSLKVNEPLHFPRSFLEYLQILKLLLLWFSTPFLWAFTVLTSKRFSYFSGDSYQAMLQSVYEWINNGSFSLSSQKDDSPDPGNKCIKGRKMIETVTKNEVFFSLIAIRKSKFSTSLLSLKLNI